MFKLSWLLFNIMNERVNPFKVNVAIILKPVN